jgi:N-acetylmuramoyl-L-alanine amidase
VTARLFPLLLSALFAFALFAPLGAAEAQVDPRYFRETRYRVDDDRFWNFFLRRGGIETFGFPVSNTFTLRGTQVQIFQRQVMQLQPNGSVGLLNLLDEGIMPYTKINGSNFPDIEKGVLKNAPGVGEKDYHLRALEYIRDTAPDVWNGTRVGFYTTFNTTVTMEDAFPGGQGDANLLPGINMEIWGLPTSRPTPDPSNGGFIYQRFQRGIMHYDWACQCTQGLLLGQYLKAIMTLRDLPSDLAEQARDSDFYGQFKPGARDSLARPKDLPDTDLSAAFNREPIVVVDPGHGGKEIGSSHTFPDGSVLAEKTLTLKVGKRVGELLADSGHAVVLTRTADRGVNEPPRDLTGDEKITVADDLQARVDLANNAGADLLLSIHFNGVSKPESRGTQTFYSDGRPHTERNRIFADLVNTNLVKALAEAGYSTIDRTASTDSSILGGASHFYLLGPQSEIIKRPSTMPAVIAEALYLTNADDAHALRQERILEALAKGYAEGVKQYFVRFPVS